MPQKLATCTVKGPAGEIVINESDLKHYEGRGYKKIATKAPEPVKASEPVEDKKTEDKKKK